MLEACPSDKDELPKLACVSDLNLKGNLRGS